ncbi:G-protein coupled receptor 52-like [Aplysia californica]|uniref:G-protein coupled receptor 52-like n=1 Tax=Aplysia californica TaxID=6500 RepID=A0ABM1A5G3_APLCA|nr:G-protein coupled receptor 52-like [Aplysia californica]
MSADVNVTGVRGGGEEDSVLRSYVVTLVNGSGSVLLQGQWVGGAPMCQTYAYVTCVFTSVSVWTIAALSWDKYQTIASPLHHSLTATVRKMLPSFSALWLCGLLLSLPPLLGGNEFTFHPSMGICGVNSASVSGRWYTCLLVCLSFIFPFCLMIYCYAHIFRIARTQSSRIAATMLRMVSVIQAPIAPATQNSLSMRGTKAMGTILQLIGSFVLTYLPYAVIILYEVIFAVHANIVFVSIATTLFLAAPFTHAAIYGIRNQILRTSFYRYARRKAQRCCAKDKRRGSVKSQGRRVPNHLKLPMKCIVKSDGRQYVLRRTLSYQDKDGGVGREAIGLGHAEGLTRPHSYNVLQKTFNGRGGGAGNGGAGGTTLGQSSPRQNGNVVKHEKEVSFSDQNEISYILPDGLSHGTRPEISFYSKDIMKEMSVMDSEMEALNGPGFEDREEKPVSVFHIGEEDEEDEEEFH